MVVEGKAYRMDEEVALGSVELMVADLDRSVDYYTRAIGFRLQARSGNRAQLGVAGRAFVALHESPGAPLPPPSSPGLSHFAPQVPTRSDLAQFTKHYASLQQSFELRNHGNARSCYVQDPDGHGIEITCSNPKDEWRWQNGQPVVVADPMDMQDLVDTPGADLPFNGLPDNTEMGHVQLKVTDAGLSATEPFYCDLLGFDVEARLGSVFLAIGVVAYRGLLVLTNRFSPDGGEPAPAGSAQLLGVDLLFPRENDIDVLVSRLAAEDYPHELADDVLQLRDPSGNLLRFKTTKSAVGTP